MRLKRSSDASLLCFVCAVVGTCAIAQEAFEIIADAALKAASKIVERRKLGVATIALVISNYAEFSNSTFPFVYVPGFETVTNILAEVLSGQEVYFCPIISPENLVNFEYYAYQQYEVNSLPNGSAVSSFGRGVWAIDSSLGAPDERYHDIDGRTIWNSPNLVLTPVLQVTNDTNRFLMYNLHSEEKWGSLIDKLLACADLGQSMGEKLECSAISDFMTLEGQPQLSSLLAQPIYAEPASGSVMTGLIASAPHWAKVFNVFKVQSKRIDCVLETQLRAFTYTATDGVVSLKGEGDLHNVSLTHYGRHAVLTPALLFSSSSVSYNLTIYPTEEQEPFTTTPVQQFEIIADHALMAISDNLETQRLGVVSMASIIANMLPDGVVWPFVNFHGYEVIAASLLDLMNGREIVFCPLVTPEQRATFEAFAYDYYENSRLPQPFPPGTAVSAFGKGIWGIDPNVGSQDNRYHETDGTTNWNSSNRVFAPIFHHSEGPHRSLLLDMHNEETSGTVIDQLIACFNARQATSEPAACSAISKASVVDLEQGEPGPSSMLMHPISIPSGESMVGLVASSLVWIEILDVFTKTPTGLECVLETESQAYTFKITNGTVSFKGDGDLHIPSLTQFGRSMTFALPNSASVQYTITLYPAQGQQSASEASSRGTSSQAFSAVDAGRWGARMLYYNPALVVAALSCWL